jgi:hypothetical protein
MWFESFNSSALEEPNSVVFGIAFGLPTGTERGPSSSLKYPPPVQLPSVNKSAARSEWSICFVGEGGVECCELDAQRD